MTISFHISRYLWVFLCLARFILSVPFNPVPDDPSTSPITELQAKDKSGPYAWQKRCYIFEPAPGAGSLPADMGPGTASDVTIQCQKVCDNICTMHDGNPESCGCLSHDSFTVMTSFRESSNH